MNISNEIDALKEQIAILEKKQEEALKPKPRTGMINSVSELWVGDEYYVLHADGDISSSIFSGSDVDSKWINQGNAAWDRATLERLRDLNELNTRARAASAKAGVIDWGGKSKSKHYVYFDFMLNGWNIGTCYISYRQGRSYFPSGESANKFMKSLTPDEQRLFAGGDV